MLLLRLRMLSRVLIHAAVQAAAEHERETWCRSLERLKKQLQRVNRSGLVGSKAPSWTLVDEVRRREKPFLLTKPRNRRKSYAVKKTTMARKEAAGKALFSRHLAVLITPSDDEKKVPWECMFCSVELGQFVLGGYTGSNPIIKSVMGNYTLVEPAADADEGIASECWQCQRRKDVVLTRFGDNGSWIVRKQLPHLASSESNWLLHSCDKAFENRDRDLSPLHIECWAVNNNAGDAGKAAVWDERKEISLKVCR